MGKKVSEFYSVVNFAQFIHLYVFNRFLEFMKNWTEVSKPSFMDVAYYSERSVEDELDRESHSDISTIAISYLVMFLYIVFTLGLNQILLSFFGIMIIIASIVGSVGFFGLIGVPLSLIVLEVILLIITISTEYFRHHFLNRIISFLGYTFYCSCRRSGQYIFTRSNVSKNRY